MASFTIRGAREMEALLNELGPRIANRLGTKALRAAARVIVKDAKGRVPVRTGELKKSITAVSGRAAKDGERVVAVGFKKPTSRRAHLTEFGTRISRAQPFMTPALESKAAEALQVMAEVLADGIAREEYKQATVAGVDFSEFDDL